jgi:hypothetical protein
MSRLILSIASALTAIIAMTLTDAHAASGKVPGLHISSLPPSYGHPRVSRVVRGFNPQQNVMSPKKGIGLAPRR